MTERPDDQPADRAAIIEVLHRNRIGLWTHDFELWASCFVHEPYLTRWGSWRRGGNFVQMGWEEMRRRVQDFDMPRSESMAYDTKIENLHLHIRSDTAWAIFDQDYPGLGDTNYIGPDLTRELRVLERHKGEWKIALFGFLDSNLGGGRAVLRLDPDGRVAWRSVGADEVLEDDDDLVIRNGRLRFRDGRLDRRLQEAIRWAADFDKGYMSAHGGMPIVVEAGEDLPMRLYWVLAEGGMILFLVPSRGITGQQLTVAAAIFGLSPAQAQLAAFVAEGLSLPEIAERMSITANTARTHLNRIYEKTGVRTQPALVRVLLSTASPL